jgi:flagellar hook-associated protein 1
MASLFGIFSSAVGSLEATQGALSATTDNIANVNTPGFTRRRAVLVEQPPETQAGVTYGRGVQLQSIESVRDEMLELRLHAEAQQHGAAQARVDALQPLDALLSDLDNGLPARVGAFFNSLTALSAQPADVPLRQAVLTAASNLASSFNQTSNKLSGMRSDLDYSVTQSVAAINQGISDIAQLNAEVTRITSLGGDASTYEDQRTAAIRQLSELADVAIVQGDDGMTITTSGGTALVVGGNAYPITSSANADGHQRVMSDGRDITTEYTGGKLGALIAVRDTDIPGAIQDLDNVAFALSNAVNQAHADGFDLHGGAGGQFFDITSISTGAALAIRLDVTDPTLIAASSNGDAGSNGNLANITAVQNAALVNGQSAGDVLSYLTFRVGSAASDAQAQLDASEAIQAQLEEQRAAVSGVSLDEEAANLMRYQRAYQAAARVIDAADEMLQMACNLGRN